MYTHTISLKSTCTHSYILKVIRYNFAIYISLKISIREQSKRINNEDSIKKRCMKKRKEKSDEKIKREVDTPFIPTAMQDEKDQENVPHVLLLHSMNVML